MMLNRDRDRESAPLLALRDKSTHRNGANSHVPSSSSLVWFREPPPPPSFTRLLKAVILDFFPYAGKSASPFYKNYSKNFLSGVSINYKENEKSG